MPTISVFFGIAIRMFFSDHPPPHFHVAYQRYRAVIAIESGAIIAGALPSAVHRLVRESMIPKSGIRFSEKIMLTRKI